MSAAPSATTAAGAAPRRRLKSRARKTVLSIHVSASVALVGATASVLVLALRAGAADRADDAHALYTAIETLAFALAIPFSMISLATGITLGLGTHWGVLRHRWVAAKLGLQVAIILTGALAVGPLTASLADAAAAPGALELGAARWQMPLAGALNLGFALTAVGLSVFKPKGRLRG